MGKVNKPYQLGLYEKSMPNSLSWEEKLTMTKANGFDYMEISIDESDEKLARLDQDYQPIIDAIAKTGVPILSMCLSGHRKYPLGSLDDTVASRSLDIMEKAINLASAIGVRIIQLAGYDVYYTQGNLHTKQNFIKNLRTCVELAARKGIILGFETMETPFMDTVNKAMEYVDLIDNPYLGVYPDIGNLKNASLLYGVPVCEDIMCGKGHVVAAHLKETGPGKYREIPFGTGHSEFVGNIKTLKNLGVRLFVGEFWYVNNDDYEQVISHANEFLRAKLDTAFELI